MTAEKPKKLDPALEMFTDAQLRRELTRRKTGIPTWVTTDEIYSELRQRARNAELEKEQR